jgi:hypothetical protein
MTGQMINLHKEEHDNMFSTTDIRMIEEGRMG